MRMSKGILQRLWRERDGVMTIETAFVVPILVVLCLGGFEASQIVARNTELRTAVSEASAIAISSPPDTQKDIDTIEDILEASTGLADNKVTLAEKYRCDNDETMTDDETTCGISAVVSTFLEITITDTYTPTWTDFGIGAPVRLSVTKTVQVS